MLVTINNQEIQIKSEQSLLEVLGNNGYQQLQGVAIAINDMVIPKSLWPSTKLSNNDNILIITATAGG